MSGRTQWWYGWRTEVTAFGLCFALILFGAVIGAPDPLSVLAGMTAMWATYWLRDL